MKLLKNKKICMIILFLIGATLLINVILKIYVSQNYDVKIITERGSSFFIFNSTDKRYYLLNTSLGIKMRTKQFEESNKITDEQLEYVQKIRNLDDQFILNDNELNSSYIFFCDDYIFYTHNTGSYNPKWSDEYKEDVLYYFYKYNIKTNNIERIRILRNYPVLYFNLKLESLIHLYPKLEDSLEYAKKNASNLYDTTFDDIYYKNGKIYFVVYYMSMKKGDNFYLYEYITSSNKTKKIIKLKENIVDVEILK